MFKFVFATIILILSILSLGIGIYHKKAINIKSDVIRISCICFFGIITLLVGVGFPVFAYSKIEKEDSHLRIMTGDNNTAVYAHLSENLKVEYWWIQVGAFANKNRIEYIKNILVLNGLEPNLSDVITDNGKLTRVRIGPYNTRDDAQQVQMELNIPGIRESMIISDVSQ